MFSVPPSLIDGQNRVTVLGSSGFIGGHLVRYFMARGFEVYAPKRGERLIGPLGSVIYAIGAVGNFREFPYAAVRANLCLLTDLLETAEFERLTYLSSSRVYSRLIAERPGSEVDPIIVAPELDDVYNLSKLAAEALVLSHHNPACRVLRLANVYGPGMSEHTFLGSVCADLARTGSVAIGESPDSGKDYVSIDDVLDAIASTLFFGARRLYNVGSGELVTHERLANALSSFGYKVKFEGSSSVRRLPPCDIGRLKEEFDFEPEAILDSLQQLMQVGFELKDEHEPR